MRKQNEYTYVGDAIPNITNEQHAGFIINYQKSILLSLVKRGVLTPLQYDKCAEKLEYQLTAKQRPKGASA